MLSKLFICVYVCESVSKLSHSKLVLNNMGISQSLFSHYILLFRFLIQYNNFYNEKGILGIPIGLYLLLGILFHQPKHSSSMRLWNDKMFFNMLQDLSVC